MNTHFWNGCKKSSRQNMDDAICIVNVECFPEQTRDGSRRGDWLGRGERCREKLNGAIVQRAVKWDFLDGNGHGSWIDSDTWRCLSLDTRLQASSPFMCENIPFIIFFGFPPLPPPSPFANRTSNPADFTPERRDKMIDASRGGWHSCLGFFRVHKSFTNT